MAAAAGVVALATALPAAAEDPRGGGEGALAQVSGELPDAGVIARLETSSTSTAALVDELTAGGCVPNFVAVQDGGAWRLAEKGTPAFALASFPVEVDGAFWLRCEEPGDSFTLTLLHHNDGESQLVSLSEHEEFGAPRTFDADGNVTAEGARVVSITLDDGTEIVADGEVVEGAPTVPLATIDFLARGGDQYPLTGKEFTTLGATYQQALRDYIVEALGGSITAEQYPEGGSGRITTE